MQRRLSKSTIPSSRRYSAVTGQISTQGASSQWLQRITEKSRRESGNSPFSIYFTQVRLTPTGTLCSDLHATVQAWQPIQRRLSMMKPKLAKVHTPVEWDWKKFDRSVRHYCPLFEGIPSARSSMADSPKARSSYELPPGLRSNRVQPCVRIRPRRTSRERWPPESSSG